MGELDRVLEELDEFPALGDGRLVVEVEQFIRVRDKVKRLIAVARAAEEYALSGPLAVRWKQYMTPHRTACCYRKPNIGCTCGAEHLDVALAALTKPPDEGTP